MFLPLIEKSFECNHRSTHPNKETLVSNKRKKNMWPAMKNEETHSKGEGRGRWMGLLGGKRG